jgi:sugar/nucleoside kinase (ribokinase family)
MNKNLPSKTSVRRGIRAAGNWLIDHVKMIDTWPEQGMLTNIRHRMAGGGGSPYNVLVDLAKMKTGLPLAALGVVGRDTDGNFILRDLRHHGIDTRYMIKTSAQPTSYTDVMTEERTGRRTFFHCRGANTLLGYEHCTATRTTARIFHLGYLLLLDKLDAPDRKFGVVAARVLHHLQQQGYKTSVDVVSEESDRFRKIVTPCLEYIDYLVFNEIEAGATTGQAIRKKSGGIDAAALARAARTLLTGGVRELVVIHFPEGGYALARSGESIFVPSFVVGQAEIKSTVGAGDAFCAGVLYGVHEGLGLEQTLKLANANARFCLTSPTSTGGAVPLKKLRIYSRNARQGKPL